MMNSDKLLAAPPSGGSAGPVQGLPTHEQLRKRAIRWLTNTKHCGAVLSEIVTAAREIPDAIGWRAGWSYVVECKVSRGDWRANAQKMHEQTGGAVGRLRYILCPEGMIRADEATDGWGLLWLVSEGRHSYVRERKAAEARESNLQAEVDLLVSAMRRLQHREFLVLVSNESNISKD
jgi:hypothetical protein